MAKEIDVITPDGSRITIDADKFGEADAYYQQEFGGPLKRAAVVDAEAKFARTNPEYANVTTDVGNDAAVDAATRRDNSALENVGRSVARGVEFVDAPRTLRELARLGGPMTEAAGHIADAGSIMVTGKPIDAYGANPDRATLPDEIRGDMRASAEALRNGGMTSLATDRAKDLGMSYLAPVTTAAKAFTEEGRSELADRPLESALAVAPLAPLARSGAGALASGARAMAPRLGALPRYAGAAARGAGAGLVGSLGTDASLTSSGIKGAIRGVRDEWLKPSAAPSAPEPMPTPATPPPAQTGLQRLPPLEPTEIIQPPRTPQGAVRAPPSSRPAPRQLGPMSSPDAPGGARPMPQPSEVPPPVGRDGRELPMGRGPPKSLPANSATAQQSAYDKLARERGPRERGAPALDEMPEGEWVENVPDPVELPPTHPLDPRYPGPLDDLYTFDARRRALRGDIESAMHRRGELAPGEEMSRTAPEMDQLYRTAMEQERAAAARMGQRPAVPARKVKGRVMMEDEMGRVGPAAMPTGAVDALLAQALETVQPAQRAQFAAMARALPPQILEQFLRAQLDARARALGAAQAQMRQP